MEVDINPLFALFACAINDHDTQQTPPLPCSREQRYYCNIPGCDRSYNRPAKLMEHQLSHSGLRPFLCPFSSVCTQRFFRSAHLKRHISFVHEDSVAREFICGKDGCGKSFRLKQHLKRHLLAHDIPKPFRCTAAACGEAFTKREQLQVHLYNFHGGELPFTCLSCVESFESRTLLGRHRKKVHKSYVCGHENCGQAFARWSELVCHKKFHRIGPFVCIPCSRSYATRASLTNHQRLHSTATTSTASTFKCAQEGCGKVLSTASALKVHLVTVHDENRPKNFECSMCRKPFATKHTLARHKKSHISASVVDAATVLPAANPPQFYVKVEETDGQANVSFFGAPVMLTPCQNSYAPFDSSFNGPHGHQAEHGRTRVEPEAA